MRLAKLTQVREENKLKDIVGVIHLPINAYDFDVNVLENWLVRNVEEYQKGGITSVMIQDQVIESLASIETISRVSILCGIVRKKFPTLKLGLILDSNDCEAAIKIALMCNFDFVRLKVFVGAMVKNTGIVQGCAAKNYRLINSVNGKIEIYADIYDKTGTPLGEISYLEACKFAIRMGATKLILTGKNIDETLLIIKEVTNNIKAPIYVGGGVHEDNISKVISHASGFIISSSFLVDGKEDEWCSKKIKDFLSVIKSIDNNSKTYE